MLYIRPSARLAVLLFVLAGPLAAQDSIPWMESYEKAVEVAEAGGKPIIILFSAGWCPACRKLADRTLTHADVLRNAEDFVWLHIDVDEEEDRCEEFAVEHIPDLRFLGPDGTEYDRVLGYVSAAALRERMETVRAAVAQAARPTSSLRSEEDRTEFPAEVVCLGCSLRRRPGGADTHCDTLGHWPALRPTNHTIWHVLPTTVRGRAFHRLTDLIGRRVLVRGWRFADAQTVEIRELALPTQDGPPTEIPFCEACEAFHPGGPQTCPGESSDTGGNRTAPETVPKSGDPSGAEDGRRLDNTPEHR